MNNRNLDYLNLAAKVAISKDDRRQFQLGAIGIRSDGAIVSALNAPTEQPNRLSHAERRLCNKLNVGSIVYVARVRRDNGGLGLAKPCDACMKALASVGVSRCYWSISDDDYLWCDF